MKIAEEVAGSDWTRPAGSEASTALLEVSGLRVRFQTSSGPKEAIHGVDLSVHPGEILGIVGESGSGKSVTAMSILGLLPPNAIVSGSARFDGSELLNIGERKLTGFRGAGIGMIFQDPLTSLNPVLSIGSQIGNAIKAHEPQIGRAALRERALGLLRLVRIPDAEAQLRRYPHEYSGGMRQRVVIAMAMANRPRLLIADEPTTALDVTVQAEILRVLKRTRDETGSAVILITHDLGVVAETCDRVAVMYSGRIVELASVHEIFHKPRHPYTAGLLASLPRIDKPQARMSSIPGQATNPGDEPTGCPFHPRCAVAVAQRCATELPQLLAVGGGGSAACHRSGEMPEVFLRTEPS